MIATLVTVYGRVQGVWYRATTHETAQKIGVCGWVRNRPDGAVEAHIEGEPAPVQQLIDWMHSGPPLAHVERMETMPAQVENFTDFSVR